MQQGLVSSQGNGGTNGPKFPNSCFLSLKRRKRSTGPLRSRQLPLNLQGDARTIGVNFSTIYTKFCYSARVRYTPSTGPLRSRQLPIHEFTLSMDNVDSTCSEIDQIILHLLRNHTLTKLKFELDEPRFGTTYGLPLSVFSLNHLTDLHLEYCDVSLKPIFNGFASLTSLTLKDTSVCREALLHLLSNCPLLKSLCLMLEVNEADHYANPSITEIFKCLPVIENLTTWGYINSLVVECDPEETNHLKYFCLEEMGFIGDYGFSFFGVITKCSPNLERIKLKIDLFDDYELDYDPFEDYSSIFKSISDVWLEHLKELEIVDFRGYELEVAFLELILARSPNLKKLVIIRSWISDVDEELEMLKTLFGAPRPPSALPLEIILKNSSRIEVFRGFDVED